jgi:hypothetical protein
LLEKLRQLLPSEQEQVYAIIMALLKTMGAQGAKGGTTYYV